MNKRIKLLKALCTIVACIGWLLIGGGCLWVVVLFTRATTIPETELSEMLFYLYGFSAVIFDFFFVGLSAVIIARLVVFIFQADAVPAFMLRCADKIFYLFAVLSILFAVFQHAVLDVSIEDKAARFIYEQPAVLPVLAKAVILILLGLILRRLLPVIQEYKSLV